MKKYVILLILLLTFHLTNSASVDTISNELVNINTCEEELGIYNYEIYYKRMAELESSNRYDVINRFGYMGRYQFGSTTLKALIKKGVLDASYEDIKKDNFINNHSLQEKAMLSLTEDNLQVLINYKLLKYNNKTIRGVKITIEGMLAASHLRGVNAVKNFLRSGGDINLTDGNNTSVMEYFINFQHV